VCPPSRYRYPGLGSRIAGPRHSGGVLAAFAAVKERQGKSRSIKEAHPRVLAVPPLARLRQKRLKGRDVPDDCLSDRSARQRPHVVERSAHVVARECADRCRKIFRNLENCCIEIANALRTERSGPGRDAADCLTTAEVDVADKIYAGPTNSRGQRLYPEGVPPGSEPFWARWVTGTDTKPSFMALFVQDGYRYLASQPPAGPLFKIADYDFDRDPPHLAYAASFINAATFNPANGAIEFDEVKAFRQAGGKLIIYHGWADALVPPRFTVDFYEALARKSGGVAMTQDFARLFMVPGMDHCGIQTNGPGIADTGIDPLTALEQWVEEGKAPSELIATKTAPTGNQTLWRRPVCAYPKLARYKGSGDPSDASSFTCTLP
jgi:hypothetical protein